MDDQEFIQYLWRTGHFWDKRFPDLLNINQEDLPFLSLKDQVVKYAVASYQQADANLEPLVYAYHHRALIADGDAGPATKELATWDRCPLPDHAPPKGAAFDYGVGELNAAVRRMQEATGSGSWPAGCHGTAGVHEVKISYDLSALTQKHREWWPEIKQRSHQACADVGIRLVEVPVGQTANITVYGRVLGGSVIGMAEFNSGTCGDTVFCQLNPNYAPDIDMVLNLLLHENGHNWNLEHRAGNIMNPSILRTPTYWIKRGVGGAIEYQDNSYPTLKNFFGGGPIMPPTPPTPPVPLPTQPNGITFGSALPRGACVITTAAGHRIDAAVANDKPAGEYVLLHVEQLPPGGDPPVDDGERRRIIQRFIARARQEGRNDAAQQLEKAIGTISLIQIIIVLAPFIIGLFSGQPIDWDALIKALLDLFTAHGVSN